MSGDHVESVDLLQRLSAELRDGSARRAARTDLGPAGATRERAPRRSVSPALKVFIEVQEAREQRAYRVHPLDISSTGLGLLHAKFIAPGTDLTVKIPVSEGRTAALRASVVRCELAVGRVHEVGVRFDTPIPALSESPAVPLDLEQVASLAQRLVDVAQAEGCTATVRGIIDELSSLAEPRRG